MTLHSTAARGGRGERDEDAQDPFDDESPFLTNNNHSKNLEDERESFIDATSDSYNAPPPLSFKNPFADSARVKDHQDRSLAAGYDSFDSQDEDEDREDETDSDYTSSSDEEGAGSCTAGGYHEPVDLYEDEREDTQRLLLTSSNTQLGGMGMGMRVGETGTGTMIGLDLEPHGNRYGGSMPFENSKEQDNEYDTLPLSTIDVERLRARSKDDEEQENLEGGKKSRGSRKGQRIRNKRNKGRESTTAEHPVLGLGAIRSEQVAAIAKRQLRVQMAWNIFYVFAWYSCSTALSFYNKWLFSPAHHNFRFPLFTTSVHMVAQFLLSSITLALLPALRPKAAPSAKDFGTKIMPCAVASGLDIGLSNSSLKTITLAFYTMCKSSSLAFVLLFAFAFKLERPTWTLAGVIAVICVGLFMMVMSEVDFVLIGFIQVMLASVLGGLRWSLTQLLLEKTNTKSGSLANPISTIFFLSPIMGICLCIVSGVFEGYGTIFESAFFETVSEGFATMGLLFLGGLFAFAMVLAEFNLIARTSVVSLSVLGIIKEVVTIVVSSLVFHDQLTLVNIFGLFITLTGIGFYHFMKLRQMKAKTRRDAKDLAEAEILKAAKKKERALERRSQREQKRAGGIGDKNRGPGMGLGLEEDEEVEELVLHRRSKEEPWNHSLTQPIKDDNEEDAFIIDGDDEELLDRSKK